MPGARNMGGGWQPKTDDVGDPPRGGGGGKDDIMETIQRHFRRQATPEVWSEVDALRERVAELEAALAKARGKA